MSNASHTPDAGWTVPEGFGLPLTGVEPRRLITVSRLRDFMATSVAPAADAAAGPPPSAMALPMPTLQAAREGIVAGHPSAVIGGLQSMRLPPAVDVAPHWRILSEALRAQGRDVEASAWAERARAQKALQDAAAAGNAAGVKELLDGGAKAFWEVVGADRRTDFRFVERLRPEVLDLVMHGLSREWGGWPEHRRLFWQAALNEPSSGCVRIVSSHLPLSLADDADTIDHLVRFGTFNATWAHNLADVVEPRSELWQHIVDHASRHCFSGALECLKKHEASVHPPMTVAADQCDGGGIGGMFRRWLGTTS